MTRPPRALIAHRAPTIPIVASGFVCATSLAAPSHEAIRPDATPICLLRNHPLAVPASSDSRPAVSILASPDPLGFTIPIAHATR